MFKVGDVVYLEGTGLNVVLAEYHPEGLWEGPDGNRQMFLAYCLEATSSFPEEDREMGIPYFYYLRDGDWLERDEILELTSDMYITNHHVYFLECMFERGKVVGRVREEAVEEALWRQWPRENEPRFSGYFEGVQLALHEQVHEALQKIFDEL